MFYLQSDRKVNFKNNLGGTDFNHPFWRDCCCNFEKLFLKKSNGIVTSFRLELTESKGQYHEQECSFFLPGYAGFITSVVKLQ